MRFLLPAQSDFIRGDDMTRGNCLENCLLPTVPRGGARPAIQGRMGKRPQGQEAEGARAELARALIPAEGLGETG